MIFRALSPSPAEAAAPALDLPRLLMRRAGSVAAVVLLLALALGLARMAYDIDDEVDAAATLAELLAGLGDGSAEGPANVSADGSADARPADDAALLAALGRRAADRPPRHLLLRVQDDTGRLLLAPAALPPTNAWFGALLAAHRAGSSAPPTRQVQWQIHRPGGARWTVTLAASHESERRESLINLLGTLALLLACVAGLLLAVRWNLGRALAPLGHLVAAIPGIGSGPGPHAQALAALPPMPVRELQAIASALQRLGHALDETEARRRLLSQQVLSLQEDERARLARELHDELGQRLTALRVDAAWLGRRLADQPAAAEVVAGMAAQCGLIQDDVRALLSRLQPFGPPGPAGPAEAGTVGGQPLARLVAMLQALVKGWAGGPTAGAGPAPGTQYRLLLLAQDQAGRPQPWPDALLAESLVLPQALALALYRISQEALTNVARHAHARQATLRLQCRGALLPGAPASIDWSVVDDGIGLPGDDAARLRGSGLPGLRERVWAQGAELVLSSNPGLALSACFETRWLPLPALTEAAR